MRQLILFNMVSLDGFFEGADGNIDWHNVDGEFNDFAIAQMEAADALVFGRKTYELMAGYWPTAAARDDDPEVAGMMNAFPKFVASRTLHSVEWEHSKLLTGDAVEAVTALKAEAGNDILLFGSANFAAALSADGLIDEFRLMVAPVLLGDGRRLFQDVEQPRKLELAESRAFASGNVLLTYRPMVEAGP